MKLLVFGTNGQVGWELNRSLGIIGNVVSFTRKEADFSTPSKLADLIRKHSPDAIINASAYTNVQNAENEPELANLINGEAVGVIASEAKKIGALLVHYSTDYVFDGKKIQSYIESDSPAPVNAYGASKLIGERAVIESGCEYLLFRTSWVYASRGGNFIRTMLHLGQTKDELKIVSDQVGTPTSSEMIADVTAHCVHKLLNSEQSRKDLTGIYHLTATGETSWVDFARFIFQEMRDNGLNKVISEKNVIPIPTSQYPGNMQRPLNSRLNVSKLAKNFHLQIPDWTLHASRTLRELLDHD